LRSTVPECAPIMKGLEELMEGMNLLGRSHSGTCRTRYSIQASSGERVLKRLEEKGEGSERKAMALRDGSDLKPRFPR
jgi:hypothetical protein